VFQPAEPLRAQTSYRVTIRPGLRDTRGYINHFMTSWPFRTR
jgi:Bacterial Ig-like domain